MKVNSVIFHFMNSIWHILWS